MRGPLLDDPTLNRRYFFPRPARFPGPTWVNAGDATLACAFRQADGSDLTIVHFHGNGEVVRDWLEEGLPGRLGEMGLSTLLAEYRGYGMSTGEPALGRMLDDVGAIVRAADQPPDRLIFFGRSVGSLFAVEAAHRFPEAAGLILESGIADPLERLLLRVDPAEVGRTPAAFAAEVEARLDQRAKLRSWRGPTLVLHARFDDLVPVTHGERLAEWAGGGADAVLFERGHHNTILAENEGPYFEAIAAFVARVRARRATTP
jgi:pimeloyl-ACP methyl ester carboxylesterase